MWTLKSFLTHPNDQLGAVEEGPKDAVHISNPDPGEHSDDPSFRGENAPPPIE